MLNEISRDFHQLNNALKDSQALWRPQPFISQQLDWQRSHPQLNDELLALSDKEAQLLHDNPSQRKTWFSTIIPKLCDTLFHYEPLPSTAQTPLSSDRFDNVGIPGRKWQQITAFAAALPRSDLPFVDWCAGKGHLSRVVQRSQQRTVHCLEWDPRLVKSGRDLAVKYQRDIQYYQHNVMQALPSACDSPDTFHIALHACGELHLTLLEHITRNACHAVALSPCCYHKIGPGFYQPLSAAAKHSGLQLTKPDLHLAVQDTVTASQGERKLRDHERKWRLGFDVLQRDIRNEDSYLNIPSCPRTLLRQDFPEFCQWAAGKSQLSLPARTDYEKYLHLGRKKYQQVFRLELLRRLFNRPLEYWLVMDRALFLMESGYEVTISRFCHNTITPRNLLIQARRI